MATIVVAGAGAALSSTASTAVAVAGISAATAAVSIAAAYIDQKYIFPALFGKDEARPESFQQQGLVRSRPGAPLALMWGFRTRVPGNIIWLDDVEESQSAAAAGGAK